MSSTELERYHAPDIESLYRYAKAYAVSKMFPDIQSAEQAFVKISAGAELGLQPFQAMNGIDIIKGKPVVKPALLAGLLDNDPDYHYEVAWEYDAKKVATACTITIFKSGEERGAARFSMDDAQRAGLIDKDNWKKFPPNMLLSRAMSNAVRWYAPGLTMGPVYVEGEIPGPSTTRPAVGARPLDESEVIDVEPTQEREHDPAEAVDDFDPATEPDPPVVTPPGAAPDPEPAQGELPPDVAAAGEVVYPVGPDPEHPLFRAHGHKVREVSKAYLTHVATVYEPKPEHAAAQELAITASRVWYAWTQKQEAGAA